jgi:hypothetical protein
VTEGRGLSVICSLCDVWCKEGMKLPCLDGPMSSFWVYLRVFMLLLFKSDYRDVILPVARPVSTITRNEIEDERDSATVTLMVSCVC